MTSTHTVCLLLVLLYGCAPSPQTRSAPGSGEVGGTYAVLVCGTECDPRQPNSMVRGYLVLEDRSFPLTAVSDSARGYLRTFTPYLLVDTADMLVDENDSTVLNACFALDRTVDAPTYAGVQRAGITNWRRDSTGTIRITLFESPDAAYVASIVVERGGMSGSGRSVMAGHGDVFPHDFIFGRRTGPPERARCVRDIESTAALQHARVRAVLDSVHRTPSPPPRVQPH